MTALKAVLFLLPPLAVAGAYVYMKVKGFDNRRREPTEPESTSQS